VSGLETFARIVDRQIVQFPMSFDDINARETPTDVYFPCYYSDAAAPLTPLYSELLLEFPQIIGNAVFVTRTLRKKTIEEMFQSLRDTVGEEVEPGVWFIDRSLITPDIFMAFYEVIQIKTQETLDAFARTRSYDDLRSLCTYVWSGIPKFQEEAERAVYLRDLTWVTLNQYFNEVQAGVQPVPTSWLSIQNLLPELTWTTPE